MLMGNRQLVVAHSTMQHITVSWGSIAGGSAARIVSCLPGLHSKAKLRPADRFLDNRHQPAPLVIAHAFSGSYNLADVGT
jgi:hypothetical protein